MKRPRLHALGLAVLGALSVAAASDYGVLTGRDPIDPATGRAAEIVPGAPFVAKGPNGWKDPVIDPSLVGDLDLVVRTGLAAPPAFAIPKPSPLRHAVPHAVAEPLGAGTKVSFVVIGSSAHPFWPLGVFFLPYGVRTADELDGRHVAVMAFADLDGDGYIGVTHLDGNLADEAIEEAEREPVGQHVFIGQTAIAEGALAIAVGGPTGARPRIALAAAAYLGPFLPEFHGGAIPVGPAVFTHLPFHPETDPDRIIGGGLVEPPDPTNPLMLLGVHVREGLKPDPGDPRYGEAFTLRLDGSDPSIDVADVSSGAFAGFGLARTPDPSWRYDTEDLKLRPAVGPSGERTVYELARHAALHAESLGSGEAARIVPVDRLGNVADLPAPTAATLRATGWLQILAPDADGDPSRESIVVDDARGVAILLRVDPAASANPTRQHLLVESAGRLNAIEILYPGTPDPYRSNVVARKRSEARSGTP